MAKYWCLVFVAAAPVLLAQRQDVQRLVAESARVRKITASTPDRDDNYFGKFKRPGWSRLRELLRDWIESRLPTSVEALDAGYAGMEARLTAELRRAGLLEPQKPVAEAGYISSLKFSRLEGYRGALLVEAGITIPCGSDVSIYFYRFTPSRRDRLFEASGGSPNGNDLVDTQFSPPNASGGRIFYVSWLGVSCVSVWNGLKYRLWRIDANTDKAVELLSDKHSFMTDEDSHVKLTAEELLLELTAGDMVPGFRRTYVLRYNIGPESVHRIDPVALQPQDFVHEWLIRPWSEMQSRSSPAVAKWHTFLHADPFGGEHVRVQQCKERPEITQVAVEISRIGDRELPEPLTLYFLVRDKGEHRYEMSEISFSRQPGCPGESYATHENPPSLFKKE